LNGEVSFIRINLMEWIFCCWFSNARRSSNRAEYNWRLLLQKKKITLQF
jgi:hypothetical protein